MSEELVYSIHLGSDKNKTTKAKKVAKNNPSGETSFANNGIFDDNDNEIANNIARRVTILDENKQIKNKKKNNDTRF